MACVDHACHRRCPCRRRLFRLDRKGVVALARERGVAQPIKIIRRWRRPWIRRDYRRTAYMKSFGVPGEPIRHHTLVLFYGERVADTLQFLLHEIEHGAQAEAFEDCRGWFAAVDEGTDLLANDGVEAYCAEPFEAAALAVEADWYNYGHLIVPLTERTA